MTEALERGDLAPDFLLPNLQGKMARFYDRFAGNAVVLCFCPSSGGRAAASELLGFAERRDQFEAFGGRFVVATLDGHEVNAKFIKDQGLDMDILSDPAGAITRGYCGGLSATELATLVIDPNQRIATAFRGGTEHARRALDGLRKLQRRLDPDKGLRRAPALLLPDVFDPALCQQLIAEWRRDHYEGVITLGTGRAEDDDRLEVAASVKLRLDHRLANEANARVSQIAGRRVVPMLHKAFQFATGSMQHYRVVAYSAERGDFFKPHRDNDSASTEDRRFAMSVNLNDEYEGGAVRFPEFGNDAYRPPTGAALIFSCSLLHEAMPVTRGTRFVALTFFFGAREQKRPPPKRLPGLGG